MGNPNLWLGLTALLSIALMCVGSWILHRKLRMRASLIFAYSLSLIIVWFVLLSPLLELWIISSETIQANEPLLSFIYIADSIVVPALLLLATSISFLILVRSVKSAV